MSETASSTPAAPVITSVQCLTGGDLPSFQIFWQPQGGYYGPFTVVVTNSGGTVMSGTESMAGSTGANWTATQTMTAATDSYYVQVEATGFPGVISAKTALLFAPVTGIITAYNGAALQVEWTGPSSVTPAGSTQILLTTPGGLQAAVSTTNGYGQMVVEENLRTSGGDWTVTLTPQFGISSGPESSPATVYHDRPVVQAVSVLGLQTASGAVTGVNLQLAIMAPRSDAPQTDFNAVLIANGAAVQTAAASASNWSQQGGYTICAATAEIAYPMNLAMGFEVAVAQSGEAATGPTGLGAPLMLLAPQGLAATVSASGNDRVVDAVITPLPAVSATPNASRIALAGPSGFADTGDPGDGFRRSMTLTAPTVGGAYVLYGAQASGASIGPWTGGSAYPGDGSPTGPGLPLITSVPAITAIAVAGEGVTSLVWSAIPDAGLTGYRVSALVDGAVVASADFSGTSGSLAAQGADISFSIAGIAGPVRGPESVPAPALAAAPTGLAAGWTSTGSQCVLSWQAPAGGATPDGYALAIYSGDTVVHQATPTGATYTVPAGVLTAGGSFTFRVAATKGGPPSLTGPQSAAAGIVSAAPTGLVTDYDGATLTARWNPVPGATGYRAVLLLGGSESGQPWYSADPETSAGLAYDPQSDYSIAVQATGPGATGPAASAAAFAGGLYPQFATDASAALIPAVAPSMAAHAIAIGLPQIFTTPPAGALPDAAPFTLSAGTSPYSYVLTIAGDAAAIPWTFTAEPIRADLFEAYGDFLGQLGEAGVTPLGMQTVQNAIARAMPQTFAETLLYSYGFTGVTGHADLTPGMVLRVEYESYLTMGSGTPNQAQLNGFITSAVADYPIVRSAGGATTFTGLDAFIARLVASGGTQVPQPPVTSRMQAGAGGLIDSGYAQMQQPFLRLVYPQSFPSTTETGTPYPEFNAVLLAAASLSDLDTATNNVRSGQQAGGNVGVLYFRGRTTMVPQLRIYVDGVEQYAPLGATLGDVLAERASQPSAVALPLTGVRMMRGAGAALVGSPAVYDAGGGAAVRIDWAPAADPALQALPLLGGDRIQLARTAP